MRSVNNLCHTWGNGFERTKDFCVHIVGEHAPASQPFAHILQECRRTTQIEVTTLRHANSLEQSCVNVSGSIEVCSYLVACSGPAVHDVCSSAGELFHQ